MIKSEAISASDDGTNIPRGADVVEQDCDAVGMVVTGDRATFFELIPSSIQERADMVEFGAGMFGSNDQFTG